MTTLVITFWLAALLLTFWLDDPTLVDAQRTGDQSAGAPYREPGLQAD